jgi:hypothetical protein
MTGQKAEQFTKTEEEIEQVIKSLSQSEAAVLFYKYEGLHLEEIAEVMDYSVRRISDFSSWMYGKLGFSSAIKQQRTKLQEILKNYYFPVVKKILASLPGERIAEKLDHWPLMDKPNLQLNPETKDLVQEDLLEEYRDHRGVLAQQEEFIKELLEQRQWNVGLVEQDLRENFREQGEAQEAYQRILKKLLEQREWKVRREIEGQIERVEERRLVPPPVIHIPSPGDEFVRNLLGTRRINIWLILIVSALMCLALTTTSYVSYRLGQRPNPLATSLATASASSQLETATSKPTLEPTQPPTETATVEVVPTETPFIPSPTNPPAPTPTNPPPPTAPPTNAPLPTEAPIPATAVPTFPPEPSVSLPFADNFDSGPSPAWENLGWQWITVDGVYTIPRMANDSYRWTWAYLNGTNWQNYRVTVKVLQLNTSSGGTNPVAIAVRAAKHDSRFLTFFCMSNMYCGWSFQIRDQVDNQSWVSHYESMVPAPIVVELEIVGNQFTARVNGADYQQIGMSGLPSGGIALGTACSTDYGCPAFDDVRIEALP